MQRKFFIPFGNTADHSIDYLLGIFYDARATTLRIVKDISTEELHWQIQDGWNTIGALLSHIIAIGHYFRIVFIEERELTEEENERWTAGLNLGEYVPELIADQSIEHYIELLEDNYKQVVEAVKGLDLEKFHKKQNYYDPENGSNLAWILYHLAEDEVHHRGQISLLRKLYKQKELLLSVKN